MTFSLQPAIVYDEECLPNIWTLAAEGLHSSWSSVWEISEYRDDRAHLFKWLDWLYQTKTPMIGFNNVGYDYPLLHYLYKNPDATNWQLYLKSQEIISGDRFEHIIWDRNRLAPQVDLYRIFHFDNVAKRTSLKALQIAMRLPNVVEGKLPWNEPVSYADVDGELIPYNKHDTTATKSFALANIDALNFRVSLVEQHGIDVLNWNDTKIGENILIQKIGQEICFDFSSGRKQKRQTVRTSIALNEIIFPYIQFQHPELNRVLQYMREQVLTPDEFITDDGDVALGDKLKTKGVFKGLSAHVGGIDFDFGTGGLHASVAAQHVKATGKRRIRDIDVAALYPNIGIQNGLYPEHLGQPFVEAYATLPKERKEWQNRKGKKCPEANALKLGSNGAYGKSNDAFSCLFDPKFTMTITINGQLMLAMLAERLANVPTLQLIQINTDGITYIIDDDYEPHAAAICKDWEALTKLTLEDANYSDMWIRDVNNYIAKPVTAPGKNDVELKLKGAYWFPDPNNYLKSIASQQPPAWHKDLGNLISIKAAVAAMVDGIDPEFYIRCAFDPFDFMLRVKVNKADRLELGGSEIQRTTRYYVARNGYPMIKISPPTKGATIGEFKRAQKVSDLDYSRVMSEIGPGVWDSRIHTKNRSKHANRVTQIQAGFMTCECNDANKFDWENINYDFYIAEARKLIVS